MGVYLCDKLKICSFNTVCFCPASVDEFEIDLGQRAEHAKNEGGFLFWLTLRIQSFPSLTVLVSDAHTTKHFILSVVRVITRAFNPGYNLAVRYANSWTDGTQAAFFNRFVQSVRRRDAVNIVKDNAKKMFETYNGRGKGDGGDEGVGSERK